MIVDVSANHSGSSSRLSSDRYLTYYRAEVCESSRSAKRSLWIILALVVFVPPVFLTLVTAATTSSFNNNNNNMGQAMRVIQYDRPSNERSAIAALQFLNVNENHSSLLEWFRLDDGVMGGQSETRHHANAATPTAAASSSPLHFAGIINTYGGGFASIRCKISPDMATSLAEKYKGIKLRVRGDGKTYKFLLSDGTGAGPISRKPSWQFDVPTENRTDPQHDDSWQGVIIPFDQLLPSFAGGPRAQPSDVEKRQHRFDASAMREMGLMLSLKRADGSPNPKETFGEGIFPFQLIVQSIEAVE